MKSKNFIFFAQLLDIFSSNYSSPANISNLDQRAVKFAANNICVKSRAMTNVIFRLKNNFHRFKPKSKPFLKFPYII